jgi:hypothetical protein
MLVRWTDQDAIGVPLLHYHRGLSRQAAPEQGDEKTDIPPLSVHSEGRIALARESLLESDQNTTVAGRWPTIRAVGPIRFQDRVAHHIDRSATHMLTDRVRNAIDGLVPLLQQHAARNYVRLHGIDLSGFTDPEDDSQEVVLSLHVGLSPSATLRYWDKVGEAIERWTSTLPPELQTVMYERLAIEVLPSDSAPIP